MAVTQGGTWTRDLANGLPGSNQLSYRVNSVAEFEYLRLSCQGSSQSGYQAGMSDEEGVASVKRETHEAQILTCSIPGS